jgi:iron(III) transport system substrate-binding protein
MIRSVFGSVLALGLTALAASAWAADVTLYTTREPGLIRPLLEAYTAKTGTKVNTVFLQAGLAERLQSEGARSPADLAIVVDAANLLDLVKRDLTQPVRSPVLEGAIPPAFRDPDGQWFALSLRARVLFVSKDRVPATESLTYEDLASPRWKGRVCIRGGQHPYNVALFSAFLTKHGEPALDTYLAGLKSNLARRPGGGDRDVAKDIAAGVCDVGVSNIYYYGLMKSGAGGPEQTKWAEAVRVVFPTFSDKIGTHMNISGAAVTKHAPNREGAVNLLEFLVGADAQHMLAEANFEAPVRAGVSMHPIIAALGTLKPDSVTPAQIAAGGKAASLAVDRAGFDQ